MRAPLSLSVSARPAGSTRFSLALLVAAALLWTAAPLAAGAAKARARTDGVGVFLNCFASGAPLPDARPGRPGPNDDRAHACALCQAFCGGVAPLVARPGLVGAAPVQSDTLSWTVADRAAPTPRRSLSHQARAPPSVC